MAENKILIVGFVWPEPRSSAAGSRMMQLIHLFSEAGFQITFASASTRSDKAEDLETLGIAAEPVAINDTSFDDFILQLQPDIVLFDRFMTEEQFGWRVAEHCPNALRILDTEDLHSLRKGRQEALKAGEPFDDRYLFNDFAKREIASIYRCDLSLIISEAEMLILKERFKVADTLLLYLPFLQEALTDKAIQALPDFNSRNHFITIGNFLHAPNYDAGLQLKQVIWPLIRQQLPKAQLHVYGAYESQKVLQLHNPKEGFQIKGFADDAHVVMQQARVCITPLRFGAGLKGKLVDAMQNGTPCVMSTIAAEGMFGDMAPNGYVTDDSLAFANKAVGLYTNEHMWKEQQQNGFRIIDQRFGRSHHESGLLSRITQLQKHLRTHRLQNFTGAMLQHHSMQSTKYMARWIEAKNKNTSD